MIKAVVDIQNYFQAPNNSFWKWADDADVIEWRDGRTICYKSELAYILKNYSGTGLPPLATVLLLFDACSSSYDANKAVGILAGVVRALPRYVDDYNDNELHLLTDEAQKFLHLVNNLPKGLRRRQQSMHLLHEIFNQQHVALVTQKINDAVDELMSGRIDQLILNETVPITRLQFKKELEYLSSALTRFPTVESLQLRLYSGIDKIPEAIEITVPEPSTLTLFEQLEDDSKTFGISRLAKHIIAALNIPMHTQGNGDQPLGGISDITNRGNYDKLLLSELAYDHDVFMARLVNNEALYLRREEPPETPKKQRVILLDTTLRMWGIPKVFALSTALACATNTKHHETIEAFLLSGNDYQPAMLDTKEDIMQCLETLDHALHCGKGLQMAIENLAEQEQQECFFITGDNVLHNASFQASLALVKEALHFIVTVNRNGQLCFYECINGKTALLSTAKFDLDDLLFTGKIKPSKKNKLNTELPLFLSQQPSPLFFPRIRITNNSLKTFYFQKESSFAINESQRGLLMTGKSMGAQEAFSVMEMGDACFAEMGSQIFLMVYSSHKKQTWLYTYDLDTQISSNKLLPIEFTLVTEMAFDTHFYVRKRTGIIKFNPITHDFTQGQASDHKVFQDFMAKRKQLEQGYHPYYNSISLDTVVINFKSIYINDAGELSLGKHCISLRDKHAIKIIDQPKQNVENYSTIEFSEELRYPHNKKVKLKKLSWNDGSEATIDSRGLLHLKSSDDSIPEITIVLLLNFATACWASDGTVSGSTSFINKGIGQVAIGKDFYENYIQRFINRIKTS
jgi:hypothetical protein